MLKVLAEHSDGLSVSELAEAMRTHRAGIYRLLGPLSDERLVVRSDGGRYTLGLGLLELGKQRAPAPPGGGHPRTPQPRRRAPGDDGLDGPRRRRSGRPRRRRAAGTTWHLAYRPGLRHASASPRRASRFSPLVRRSRASDRRSRSSASAGTHVPPASCSRCHRRRCTRSPCPARRRERASAPSGSSSATKRGGGRRHPFGPSDRSHPVTGEAAARGDPIGSPIADRRYS